MILHHFEGILMFLLVFCIKTFEARHEYPNYYVGEIVECQLARPSDKEVDWGLYQRDVPNTL